MSLFLLFFGRERPPALFRVVGVLMVKRVYLSLSFFSFPYYSTFVIVLAGEKSPFDG